MNKLNKQGINILKIIFSNTVRRISLFVSLIFMLMLSGVLASLFFISDFTLNKLAQSKYLQNKIVSEYLDFSLDRNSMIISKNVVFTNLENILEADVVEMDIQKR